MMSTVNGESGGAPGRDGVVPEPKYSVLITSFRSLRFLRDSLGSVLKSTGPSFELLFLENGSPEPEAEWIANNLADARLRVFKIPRTLFFAGGINYLARRARGEFLVMLNADTRVVPEWLSVLDHRLAVTGFEGMVADIREDSHPDRPTDVVALDPFGMTHLVRLGCDQDTVDLVMGGCGLALRRDIFLEAGGLDESFRMYFEDIDLCWRLGLQGHRIGYAAGAIVYHAGQGSSVPTLFAWNRFRARRNRIWSYVKNAGPWTLTCFLPTYGILSVIRVALQILRGRFRLAWAESAGVAAAVFHLKVAWSQRGAIQRARRVSDSGLARRGFLINPFRRRRANP
jgi:GT2 family glycosyltransferase